MNIGFIGLGKMGQNMVARLVERGWMVVAYDADIAQREVAEKSGARFADSLESLVRELEAPQVLWIMVPHTVVDEVLGSLVPFLAPGDTVIDGGNTPYGESVRRSKELQKHGINFLDAGVSGGPQGAREGACIMVGGDADTFKEHESIFRDLAGPDGYLHVGGAGAGHFVKMIHNGIEYGMMQSIAEGFAILKASSYEFDLKRTAELLNHGSVIESRLIGLMPRGFQKFGEDLRDVSGSVAASGEGAWTVAEAERLNIPVPAIKSALDFRTESQTNPSYIGKILSMLRNQFGGHSINQTSKQP